MNDRRLLELAAKGAGYKTNGYYEPEGLFVQDGHPDYVWGWWNPLEHDCDAFRLLINTNLLTKHLFLDFLAEENEVCDGDYCKAARRAATRAAAKIGRAMK